MPERNISKTKPSSLRTSSAPLSGTTLPNPLRPTIIPATISPTTIGIASRPRTDERSSGARNASMTTTSRGANERASSIETSQLYDIFFSKRNELIVGKPPALLGDSQSLTFAGVERKPPNGEPLGLNQEEAQ